MAFRHIDLEIPENTPFLNCKLGREKYAKILTTIIESYPEGFVLAINNKWGTGKTTFVKMWEQQLKNNNFKTIYFNAWENDFEDNPLTAFVGELQIFNKERDETFNKVVQNAALISKNVIPAVLKAFLNKYVDSETLVTTMSDTSKSFLESFEGDIKEYSKRKESISEFRKSLSEFVANKSNGKPLVFIIDELDRCRPNYSVLLLEQIKHFFSVPNIIFVLSIDRVQLENAICGVYGSEKIDSNEYLRRFIDIEYSVPNPDKEKFIQYLYEYFEFDSFFNSLERRKYSEVQDDKDAFLKVSKALISSMTLRQQEKIFAHTRLALRMFNSNSYVFPHIFIFLSFAKVVNAEFYWKLSNRTSSLKEIQEEFYLLIKPYITESTQRLFVYIESELLKFYENDKLEYSNNSDLFEVNESGKYILKIDSKIDNDIFLAMLKHIENKRYFDFKLSHLLDKLNLLNDIKIN